MTETDIFWMLCVLVAPFVFVHMFVKLMVWTKNIFVYLFK